LSAVHDCLFNLFTATLHKGGRSSIRNLRTRHAVVTGTHYTGSAASTVINLCFLSKGKFGFHLKTKYRLPEKYKQGYRKVPSCHPHTVYRWCPPHSRYRSTYLRSCYLYRCHRQLIGLCSVKGAACCHVSGVVV